MRWKLLLTPVCRDGPDSMVLKNTRGRSDFSHTFVRVTETLSIRRKGTCQAASYSLWLSWILVKWKIIVCLPKGKIWIQLTRRLNLQHGPWLSGCLLLRKYGNTLKLIVCINNTGPESIIVINLVSKAFAIMLGVMANFEARGRREWLWNKHIVMSCGGWEKEKSVNRSVSFSLWKEDK